MRAERTHQCQTATASFNRRIFAITRRDLKHQDIENKHANFNLNAYDLLIIYHECSRDKELPVLIVFCQTNLGLYLFFI